MVSKTPGRRECAYNADLILDAAKRLLRTHGYKRMTMDDLAREAGMGKGTLYLYFESKEDVALSVIDRSNARLQEQLRQILRDGTPAKERVRRMLTQRVLVRFDEAQSYCQGIDDLLFTLRPQLFERRTKYQRAEQLILAEVLIEGRVQGEFEVEDPYEVADAMLTATSALLPNSLSPQQLGDRPVLERRIGILADLLVKSLSPKTK